MLTAQAWSSGHEFPLSSPAERIASVHESPVVPLQCLQHMHVVARSRGSPVMPDYTLVFNAGSSSLKFCVFERSREDDWDLSSRGQVDGIGASPRIAVRDGQGRNVLDERLR